MATRPVLIAALGVATLPLVPSVGHGAPPSERVLGAPEYIETLSCDWLEQPGYEAQPNQIPDVDPPDEPRNPLWLPRAPLVSNTAELRDALSDPTLTDIVLLPGDYDCDLLDSGACEISNWQVWQCDDTHLDNSHDGCLQN